MQTRNKSRTVSMRLSAVGGALLDELSKRRGISKTAFIETLLRDTAEQKGIPIPIDSMATESAMRGLAAASMRLADERYGIETDYDDL